MINERPSFGAARVNILATADNHGNIMRLPKVLKTIENNAKEIFPGTGKPSTANFFTIVGDWFINPSKKGFLTKPGLTNGDLQNLALLKTIELVKNILSNFAKKTFDKDTPLEHPVLNTLYAPGNHCLDGGTKFLLNVMRKNPMTSLLTNVNPEKSPAVKEIIDKENNIVSSSVFKVQDDKNPNLLHKILFLGVTIPSMDFYNPGLCDGLEFFDNSNKKDANLTENDIPGTINAVKNVTDLFKKENPKGVVVLLSHLGGRLSEIIQSKVPQINLILNGHDHKNTQANVGKTSINSLGKDNLMIKALNLEFDDNGNLIKTLMTPYFPETTLADGLEHHPFTLFLNEILADDMSPLISLDEFKTDNSRETIEQKLSEYIEKLLDKCGITNFEQRQTMMNNPVFKDMIVSKAREQLETSEEVPRGIKKLSYGDEIRYKNSYLMNYLTSALKRNIRDKIDADVFTVALQSSIVRGSLEDGADNLKVMKIFDGVSEDLSDLKIGNVQGFELVGLITENVLANLKAPTRNTIIHWSDVRVNRTLIEQIQKGLSSKPYSEAISVRNQKTKQFEPIDLNKEYRMVIGEKYLVKNDIDWPGKIRERFNSLGKTYDEIFRDYISSVNYKLMVTPKTKEARIV